jgi:hypothetical protein
MLKRYEREVKFQDAMEAATEVIREFWEGLLG